jgi:hypothetical protein
LASRHIGSERSADEGERRNRGNEKLCHVIPPSTAAKNISKIDEGALIHVNSELKRPHAQSDAVSAASALLTTPMETPITNVARNMVRPPSKEEAATLRFFRVQGSYTLDRAELTRVPPIVEAGGLCQGP